MSATYSFLPWARQGLGNQIDATGALRASASLELEVQLTQPDGGSATLPIPQREVQLYGPGDIVGVDARAVIRTEPLDWITNFEPNYLAAIEFYDEDFPWRYTPTPPDASGKRLRPWIALVVLKQGEEFSEGANIAARPLPYITLKNNARQTAFPDPETCWAWAHVHVNRGLTAGDAEIVAADREAVAARLAATVNENGDLAYSRLVCPRRLKPNVTYCAFLVPAFESGRLAGLGLDVTQAPSATASSWTSDGAEAENFPIYFRWQFRTGAVGDFEYLVRLLQPKPVDRRVGTRDIDVQQPGMINGLSDPDQYGALPLGGALRVPRGSLSEADRLEVERRENWAQPYPHVFQRNLAAVINLADTYAVQTAPQANAATALDGVAGDPDPVVAPPLYGRWASQTPRLLAQPGGDPVPNADNWVHQINLDPIYRVPTGFGTRVVQAQQEELMAAAWAQVGDVLAANQRIRRLKFAQQVAFVWHQKQLAPLLVRDPAKALALTSPVQARVMAATGPGALTMKARFAASATPPALLAPTMRRLTRPRARLMRALPFGTHVRAENLVARVNAGEIQTAPTKTRPSGAVALADVIRDAVVPRVPDWLADLLRRYAGSAFAPLSVAIVLAPALWLIGATMVAPAVVLALGVAITAWLLRIRRRLSIADALSESGQTPASVDALPASRDFVFTEPDTASASITITRDASDGAEGVRFKRALKDLYSFTQAGAASDAVGENGPARTSLHLPREAEIMVRGLDPAITIPRRAAALVKTPQRLRDEQVASFSEVMAYPVFDLPMYKPLADTSAELLIPNVNLIESNSITLLETNQRFIEAYMVGLNHEFARELLWREYPTDQRGSYFRQFWDTSSFFAGPHASPDALRERLRDIPPLHTWPHHSKLGDHDARESPGDNEEELVLVIRGELLKRYPNAVIYAQRAEWAVTNGVIDPSKERSLVTIEPAEVENPPREKLRTPLYMAKIGPDLCFLGFDLTFGEALGGDGTGANDPPGWFFVIKERPGEPRFGFDETGTGPIVVWNDLAWDRVPMAGENVGPLPPPGIQIPSSVPPGEEEKEDQRKEDVQVRWGDDVSAAELAYIMYQAPAMVAVHAAEMLPRRTA
jgi:hypothetical protein